MMWSPRALKFLSWSPGALHFLGRSPGALNPFGTLIDELLLSAYQNFLRAVCCKDQLRSFNIEKTDFPTLCQNKGLGELVLKIQVSGRLDFYIFLRIFFVFCALSGLN